MRKSYVFRGRLSASVLAITILTAFTVFISSAFAGAPEFVEGQILIKPKAGAVEKLDAVHKGLGAQVAHRFKNVGDIQLVRLPKGMAVANAVAFYNKTGHVEFAEPDYIVSINATPNDPKYLDGTLWGLHNTGQSGGTADADIDAPEGWDVRTDASAVIVAVIDTGVRYTHEDLAANMWKNPGETGLDGNGNDKATNGIDDDGNGLVDDVYGAKYVGNQVSGDPMDDHGHGTHVSGTIGGVGNNGKGVAGVCWKVKIMALKFLSSGGSGSTSDAIKCVDYARAKGAHIMSNSWGGGGYSQSLYNAINNARLADILFVAAAGNNGSNNDVTAFYPANYNLANIISVAATDRNDALASFSNYGAVTVHLGAPGVSIYSCYRTSDSSYATMSGTSMATPQVSGVCAMVKAHYPNLTYQQVKDRVLTTTDPLASLNGKTTSGGRLNLYKALTQGVQLPAQIAVAPNGYNYGSVEVGSTANFSFTVSNTGSETLNGSASVAAPYSIVGGSPYSVPGGGSVLVTVRFAPSSAGSFTGVVTFTGGGGATAVVTGNGTVTPPPGNQAPTVVIASPADNSTYGTADTISFVGGASDPEDGDLTGSLVWTSNIDGIIGNGGSFTSALSAGTHVITASAVDSGGVTGSKTITVNVVAPAPPNAPSNLSATGGKGTATLTWSDNSGDETGFAIERCTKAGKGWSDYVQIATVGANTTTFTDIGLAGGNYRYQVRAFNANGNSGYSNAAQARVK